MGSHRPAGLSDEDDSDLDCDFEYSSSHKTVYNNHKQYFQETVETDESKFYSALTNGDIDSMRSILAGGFHIDQPLQGGWSALMHACLLGLMPAVEFLIKKGANVNFNKELFTPLMALSKSKSLNKSELNYCFDLLLKHNANINALDRHATTALMNASSSGNIELVTKLLESQCDVNIQDTLGRSALFHAVNEGYEDIVRVLIEGKARLDLIDKQRRTAYDLATLKGYDHIAKLVCSKKDRRKIVEEDKEDVSVSCLTTKDMVQQLLAQLPVSNKKSHTGFPSDVGKLLNAMDLRHLTKLFEKNNVQLNEFLLMTDEKLKGIGIRFSVHRQRILSSIKKLHIHHWNKSSLGMKPRNQTINLEDGVKLMCNVTKQLHVLYATLSYVSVYQISPNKPNMFESVKSVKHQLELISCELDAIQTFALYYKNKEKLEPIDLIKPKKTESNRCYFVLTSLFAGFVFGFVCRRTLFIKSLLRLY